jgi:hypothetical protein
MSELQTPFVIPDQEHAQPNHKVSWRFYLIILSAGGDLWITAVLPGSVTPGPALGVATVDLAIST